MFLRKYKDQQLLVDTMFVQEVCSDLILEDCMGEDKLLFREQNAIYVSACEQETSFSMII